MFIIGQTPNNAADFSSWAQFGLAGLVIATLFGLLLFLFKSHQSERTEWRNELRDMHTRGTSAVDGLKEVTHQLTIAIKELTWHKDK